MINSKILILFIITLPIQNHFGQHSIIEEHLTIKIYPNNSGGEIPASAMPEFKKESILNNYKRRFEFLIFNIPKFHSTGAFQERIELFSLYPDTLSMKELIMEKYSNDSTFNAYFEDAYHALIPSKLKKRTLYTVEELMDVSSRFFYCDQVNLDTSIQSRVCVGLNGLTEVKWDKDYTLLAAFCYEAIFDDFDKNQSKISEEWDKEKSFASAQFRTSITTLEDYLENVKTELILRMKNNEILRETILKYYLKNKKNLAFRILI